MSRRSPCCPTARRRVRPGRAGAPSLHSTAVQSGQSVESDSAYSDVREATSRLVGTSSLSASDLTLIEIGHAPDSWYEALERGRVFADVAGRAGQAIVLRDTLDPLVFDALTRPFAPGPADGS